MQVRKEWQFKATFVCSVDGFHLKLSPLLFFDPSNVGFCVQWYGFIVYSYAQKQEWHRLFLGELFEIPSYTKGSHSFDLFIKDRTKKLWKVVDHELNKSPQTSDLMYSNTLSFCRLKRPVVWTVCLLAEQGRLIICALLCNMHYITTLTYMDLCSRTELQMFDCEV